jgi:hypothetical protein
MNQVTELWFDLEGTIIPHFSQINELINSDTINKLVGKYNPQSVGIFSYALWCDGNIETFHNSKTYEKLLQLCNVPTIEVISVSQMAEYMSMSHKEKPRLNLGDVWKIPKEFTFQMVMTQRKIADSTKFNRVVLCDDTVMDGLVIDVSAVGLDYQLCFHKER